MLAVEAISELVQISELQLAYHHEDDTKCSFVHSWETVCVVFLGTEVAMDLNSVAAPAKHLFKGTLLLACGNFYNPNIWEIQAETFL